MAKKNQRRMQRSADRCSDVPSRSQTRPIAALGFFALAILLFGSFVAVYRSTTTQRFFETVVESLDSRGDVVFDESNGTPKRLLICLKQMHGGPSSAPILIRENRSFDLFFQHQDALRAMLGEALKWEDIGNVHFFLEGFVGEKESWPPDAKDVLSSAAEIDQALSSSDQRRIVLMSIKEMMLHNPKEMSNALTILLASGRFASYCHTKGYPVIHGADPPGHPVLVSTIQTLLQSLVSKESVTDTDITEGIEKMQQSWAEDEAVRHQYIVEQMKHVPNGGIGIVLLGAGHFGAGANYTDSAALEPLELALASLPNTRTIVLDEAHLQNLLTETKRYAKIVGRNITPKQVRMYLESQSKK